MFADWDAEVNPDWIGSSTSIERIVGSAYNDFLYVEGLLSARGGGGQDYIRGTGSLYGEAGYETLMGWGQGTQLWGGSGLDSFG